jgi:hypothetical protein
LALLPSGGLRQPHIKPDVVTVAGREEKHPEGRSTEDSGLVDGRVVSVAVVHIRAVEKEIIGPSARAVHGKNAERAWRIRDLIRRAGYARREKHQFGVIAPARKMWVS